MKTNSTPSREWKRVGKKKRYYSSTSGSVQKPMFN